MIQARPTRQRHDSESLSQHPDAVLDTLGCAMLRTMSRDPRRQSRVVTQSKYFRVKRLHPD